MGDIMTEHELLSILKSYRNLYYTIIALEGEMESINSPLITNEPRSTHSKTKTQKYNDLIIKKEEISSKMKRVENIVELLKDDDIMIYNTIRFKFISGKTLEEIGYMFHYSKTSIERYYKDGKKHILTKINSKQKKT